MVEFALILFPLLLLVAGIIQFGIALNFWLDQNRIANQGARWAVVNAWPGCPRTQAGACNVTSWDCTGAAPTGIQLQTYLQCQAISQGLRGALKGVTVCYMPDGDGNTDPGDVGSPVRVRMESDFELLPILGVGTITLVGQATMRIENNNPSHLISDPAGPQPPNPCPTPTP
jgi:hypothetical protein